MSEIPQFSASRPLVVVTTVTRWHEPPRIRHQVTRQLLRFYNVLYVELPFGNESPQEGFERVGDSLVLFRPKAASPLSRRLRNHISICRSMHDSGLVAQIERAIVGLGYESAVLINFQFNFPTMMSSKLMRRKIYLCNDDFHAFSRFSHQRVLNRTSERKVIERADISLAVSSPLVEQLRFVSEKVQLFLPGHEFDTCTLPKTALRPRLKPIHVTYMGFINSRLRIDWLREMADHHGIRLMLVGPIERQDDWKDLLQCGNVEHSNALEGDMLARKLRDSDVLIMPYDVTQAAVRAITAPNKLFQYLACGRPVVCSNLPSVIDLPKHFLYIASDAGQFVAAVERAFAEDNGEFEAQRLAYASKNSWGVRGEALRRLIDDDGVR